MSLTLLEGINLNELIEKAVTEKCEITITADAEKIEIKLEPWKPFEYNCPYK